MKKKKQKNFCSLCGLAVAASISPGLAATRCTALSGMTLPLDNIATTLSLSATDEPGAPPFCSILAIVSSDGAKGQSQIKIAVWLPETGWNGRFLGTGNGGFGGAIDEQPMRIGLSQNFAVANTDLGTGILFKCNGVFCGSRQGYAIDGVPVGGLLGHEAAIQDFGYGATHLMTLAGKQLIAAYYGRAPSRSYFDGCSTGGGQGLAEAQRYPRDYDGIVAGSPAYARTHLISGGNALYEIAHVAPDALLTTAARTLATSAVLAACAGHDGGLPTDAFLTQPALCHFHAASLQCTGAAGEIPCTNPQASGCTCLAPHQLRALTSLWSGALDDHGAVVDPGYERGAESAPTNAAIPPAELTEPLHDSLDYWAFGKDFAWQTLFSTVTAPTGISRASIRALDKTRAGEADFYDTVNAMHADLHEFAAGGGKLLLYAGYADPVIPSADTIDYYNQALRDDPGTPRFVKLFLAPGMWHCEGGPGLNAFGNIGTNPPPEPGAASDDILAAMIAWRETGKAPKSILATHYINNQSTQGIAFQRPLCPYPETATAPGFTCTAGKPVVSQRFGKGYGPK